MRLAKSCLSSQQRYAERAPLYPAQQFQAESLVHLSKVHLWIICHQQWTRIFLIFLQKSYQGCLAFIFSAFLKIEKYYDGNLSEEIDAQEASF